MTHTYPDTGQSKCFPALTEVRLAKKSLNQRISEPTMFALFANKEWSKFSSENRTKRVLVDYEELPPERLMIFRLDCI